MYINELHGYVLCKSVTTRREDVIRRAYLAMKKVVNLVARVYILAGERSENS